MVCVPCFIIPVLLYVWHRFIQPYVLRYWNPWAKKDKDGNVIPHDASKSPFDCSGGKCTFMAKKKDIAHEDQPLAAENTNTVTPNGAIESDADKKDA